MLEIQIERAEIRCLFAPSAFELGLVAIGANSSAKVGSVRVVATQCVRADPSLGS